MRKRSQASRNSQQTVESLVPDLKDEQQITQIESQMQIKQLSQPVNPFKKARRPLVSLNARNPFDLLCNDKMDEVQFNDKNLCHKKQEVVNPFLRGFAQDVDSDEENKEAPENCSEVEKNPYDERKENEAEINPNNSTKIDEKQDIPSLPALINSVTFSSSSLFTFTIPTSTADESTALHRFGILENDECSPTVQWLKLMFYYSFADSYDQSCKKYLIFKQLYQDFKKKVEKMLQMYQEQMQIQWKYP